MHFHSAYLKLTLFYVLIAMTISITFSVVLYNVSSDELGRGLGRQARVLQDLPQSNPILRPMIDLEKLRQDQIDESNNHLRLNLLWCNLLILLFSTGASYLLARRTLRPIEEAMESQNRFTADAAHELRTPLTAMRTEIEVAMRDKELKLKDSKELLSSNLEEIGKLELLSGALLKLARFQDKADEPEKARANFKELNLAEIITQAFEKVESLAEQKSIEFENDLVDLKVYGDKKSLTELFVILLDNAIKYSPDHSKVSIITKKERDQAVIIIRDQGIGIKESDLPYIFNRFYRADTSRSKEKVDGYGLGLAIARRIAEIHEGVILAKSKPGEGSEFVVKLPDGV